MQFIYPYYNATIKLTKQLDGSQGRTIYWHLDNESIGETSDVHQMELSPSKGKHRVTVVDEEGNSLGVEFEVE